MAASQRTDAPSQHPLSTNQKGTFCHEALLHAPFGSLLFAGLRWQPVWLPFTAYATALIAARLLFGQLPDRLVGAEVALPFVLVEAAGLLFMGMAVSAALATVGAALTGFGHALVFPGFGTEAVRHAHGDLHSVS